MTTSTDRPTPRAVLDEALGSAAPLVVPGVYDGLSARLAAQLGFRAIYVSGAGSAAARGMPDMSVISLSEMTDAVRVLGNAAGLPPIVDIDTGFGGPTAIRRCVGEMEAAGAAAVHIEDQPFPKRCGYLTAEECIPIEDMLIRLEAARTACSLLVIARTDSLLTAGLPEAIARVRAYRAAGAEMIMVNGITRLEELEQLSEEAPGALLYNVSGSDRSPALARDIAVRCGVKIAIYPIQAARAAIAGAERVLRALANGAPITADSMMPFQRYMDLAGWADAETFERDLERKHVKSA